MQLNGGWLVDARRVPSPHHDCRPDDEAPVSYTHLGMSSESAMTRHVGGVAQYRAAEGKTVKLPLRLSLIHI